MRLETTMSDSGPVPRSHSPLDCVRLSRFIGGFLLLDRIAQAGGLFVSLRVDGTTEAVTQVAKLGLRCGMARCAGRHLAAVTNGPMDALHERQQGVPEHGVIVRASQKLGR